MQLFHSPPRRTAAALVIPQDVPVYRIGEAENGTSGFYCDDELFPEGAVLAFEGVPSPCMEPLNDLALSKMRKYLDTLDVMGKEKARKDKTNYVSMRDAFERKLLAQASRRSRRLDQEEHKPILGGKLQGPPKARRITEEDEPEAIFSTLADKDTVNAISEDPKLGGKVERLNG